ncbi:cobalamin B12-binding domain-containing protein [Afifella pfennigii]|uniref:cobalamin B12-binding domain-containing protein n=1 Tax=Afifella pfennigii TaxID=209897 RepID=UPI0009FF4D29|nr:cobalamin B12-binding domain-containing protein [Afifella pfennigii]
MADLRQTAEGRRRWNREQRWNEPHDPRSDAEKAHSVSGSEAWLGSLVTTIEGEIIPRLLLAHGASAVEGRKADPHQGRLGSHEIADFARLVIGPDFSLVRAHIDMMRARGITLETIFIDLMAPTARLLGDLWKADECDFTDVTIGLSRLQQLLREFGPAFQSAFSDCTSGRRALLVPAPGEQHTFGLFITEEFFRRSGWQVMSALDLSSQEIADTVRTEWFSIVGFSLSGERWLNELAVTIEAVRQKSRNQSIGIMVGGQLFFDRPELVALVGADVAASDARQAVLHAERMLGAVSMRW